MEIVLARKWGSQSTTVEITRKQCFELVAVLVEEEHGPSVLYGLKTLIKKSGTIENPDRLFHACPRYRKDSHCNYFRWVEDDEYE
ncbi:hypothetical protein Ahy_B05g075503 [Arachis hypogaea]|uniref:GRF-type domain-containing protein n=1 Tax=Arachis hypogaea TaxID=3818 RepID=A0A444Z1C5_ARAHY|nr:hypothetical protein Ahy_B05g075503 [Arachis hypogaea]